MMEPAAVRRWERHIDAMAQAADDADGLAALLRLQTRLDRLVHERALALNAEGFSWRELGAPLGLGGRSMSKRFSRMGSA